MKFFFDVEEWKRDEGLGVGICITGRKRGALLHLKKEELSAVAECIKTFYTQSLCSATWQEN